MNENVQTPAGRKHILRQLVEKGVCIPCPESVEIGHDVSIHRISGKGVTIHSGCKIFGPETLIMEGVELGYEAPVTLRDCQLGREVKLKGGAFYESTFLAKASMGSGAQLREVCLIEEGAKGAHTVGLKQTILFPFVTLGSLINFCDCLMAGGTGEKNHSEVGSSYIHFNYTLNQDKATPSLLGDVPRGVMINQNSIFLGGQGGMVGPLRVEFGVQVAAGTIVRKDLLKGDTILLGGPSLSKTISFHPGLYTNLKRIVTLNARYIANLVALRRWYLDVRLQFTGEDRMASDLYKAAIAKLEKAIDERLKRLGEVAARMPQSIEIYKRTVKRAFSEDTVLRKREFFDRWPDLEQTFRAGLEIQGDPREREEFMEIIDSAIRRDGKDYIEVIKGLNGSESDLGVSWLQGVIDALTRQAWALLPGLGGGHE